VCSDREDAEKSVVDGRQYGPEARPPGTARHQDERCEHRDENIAVRPSRIIVTFVARPPTTPDRELTFIIAEQESARRLASCEAI
jgi:hypothetical protein